MKQLLPCKTLFNNYHNECFKILSMMKNRWTLIQKEEKNETKIGNELKNTHFFFTMYVTRNIYSCITDKELYP